MIRRRFFLSGKGLFWPAEAGGIGGRDTKRRVKRKRKKIHSWWWIGGVTVRRGRFHSTFWGIKSIASVVFFVEVVYSQAESWRGSYGVCFFSRRASVLLVQKGEVDFIFRERKGEVK